MLVSAYFGPTQNLLTKCRAMLVKPNTFQKFQTWIVSKLVNSNPIKLKLFKPQQIKQKSANYVLANSEAGQTYT
jgi:hypothetical protein